MITKELFTQKQDSVFLTEPSKSGLVTTLLNSTAVVKILRQAVSDTASTQNRTVRDTLFQAPDYRLIFSQYRPVLLQDFAKGRQVL